MCRFCVRVLTDTGHALGPYVLCFLWLMAKTIRLRGDICELHARQIQSPRAGTPPSVQQRWCDPSPNMPLVLKAREIIGAGLYQP